jgi:hypothetical protein
MNASCRRCHQSHEITFSGLEALFASLARVQGAESIHTIRDLGLAAKFHRLSVLDCALNCPPGLSGSIILLASKESV